jgi:hypothetical protein
LLFQSFLSSLLKYLPLLQSKDKINEALRKITKCKGADVEISESHVEWNIECKNKDKDGILKEFTHTIKSKL